MHRWSNEVALDAVKSCQTWITIKLKKRDWKWPFLYLINYFLNEFSLIRAIQLVAYILHGSYILIHAHTHKKTAKWKLNSRLKTLDYSIKCHKICDQLSINKWIQTFSAKNRCEQIAQNEHISSSKLRWKHQIYWNIERCVSIAIHWKRAKNGELSNETNFTCVKWNPSLFWELKWK